jgi:hypothetical protein
MRRPSMLAHATENTTQCARRASHPKFGAANCVGNWARDSVAKEAKWLVRVELQLCDDGLATLD